MLSGKHVKRMETLQRYSVRYVFSNFFIITLIFKRAWFQVLFHAHIRLFIRYVSAVMTRCCLVFDGCASSRKEMEQLCSTCGVSSNSFLNGSYLIPIFPTIHRAGVGKLIEVTFPFTAGLQMLLLIWRRLSLVTA